MARIATIREERRFGSGKSTGLRRDRAKPGRGRRAVAGASAQSRAGRSNRASRQFRALRVESGSQSHRTRRVGVGAGARLQA